MKRRVRANHRTGVPSSHVVVDTETLEESAADGRGGSTHRPFLIVARAWRWDGERASRGAELVAREPEEFWAWLYARTTPKKATWLWAHNLAFDLPALRVWDELTAGRLRIDPSPAERAAHTDADGVYHGWRGMIATGDPPTILSARTEAGHSVRAVDTLNWAMLPLEAIGLKLGLEKLPRPSEIASDDDWLVYCRRDVEVLQRAVYAILRLVRRADLGNLRCTLASQAHASWRHLTPDNPVVINDDLAVKNLERACCWPARSQCHYRGAVIPGGTAQIAGLLGIGSNAPVLTAGPVYRLDLVGAYPSVMAGRDYPVELVRHPPRVTVRQLAGYLASFIGAASVVVHSELEPYPVRIKNEVSWRVGKFQTCLCGPELVRAVESGHVVAVLDAQLYRRARPFDAWVDRLWALRRRLALQGDAFGEYLVKQMAAQLHGKFMQKEYKWLDLVGEAPPQLWGCYPRRDRKTGQVDLARSICGRPQLRVLKGERADSAILLGAVCVAYHRERVRADKLTAGVANVLYEDADSLHVTQAGFEQLGAAGRIADDVLGSWRVEQVAQVAEYHGRKCYRLDDRRIRPGIAVKATLNADHLWEQTDFLHLDALLAGEVPSPPVSYLKVSAEPVATADGQVTPSGWVVPWRCQVYDSDEAGADSPAERPDPGPDVD